MLTVTESGGLSGETDFLELFAERLMGKSRERLGNTQGYTYLKCLHGSEC